MLVSALKITCALSLCAGVGALTGCTCGSAKAATFNSGAPCPLKCGTASDQFADALPPNAKPGECYAKVYMPPEYRTVSERVMVRDAYEEIEIVPAQYEWVEEQVCVKDASEHLVTAPAQFATRDYTFEARPGSTEWEINRNPTCVADSNQPAQDVFCLVNRPPIQQTLQTQCLAKPAQVETVFVPAEYQTIRRQKLVSPATTRTICIPAEYAEVQKTVKVCDGKMVWKRVDCDTNTGLVTQAADMSSQAAPPATADATPAHRH